VTVTDLSRPAWSDAFAAGAHPGPPRIRPFGTMDRQAAFGDTGGRGVTVAIIDSGVEADHPAIGGRLVRSLRVESGGDSQRVVDDPEPGDLVGHGTACAGIIHAIAPAATLVSIRVLGPDNRGAGTAFAAALEWAIGERFVVEKLSLSSRSEAMAERFHELADAAYFANTLLVAAANNVIGPS
jgi:subtilisin